MTWIVYRDVKDFPRRQFEVIAEPGPDMLVIKDTTIPAMPKAGYDSPVYIRKFQSGNLTLVTYTEAEPDRKQVNKLLKKARKLAKRGGN